jgi:hypothetical protein
MHKALAACAQRSKGIGTLKPLPGWVLMRCAAFKAGCLYVHQSACQEPHIAVLLHNCCTHATDACIGQANVALWLPACALPGSLLEVTELP